MISIKSEISIGYILDLVRQPSEVTTMRMFIDSDEPQDITLYFYMRMKDPLIVIPSMNFCININRRYSKSNWTEYFFESGMEYQVAELIGCAWDKLREIIDTVDLGENVAAGDTFDINEILEGYDYEDEMPF